MLAIRERHYQRGLARVARSPEQRLQLDSWAKRLSLLI
jgi:hypothetical protein